MPDGGLQTKGFFAALFDFSFTSFITLKFLKVIYGVLVVVVLLTGLLFLVVGLARGGAGAVLSIVAVPLVTLLYLVMVRIWMELIALFFRIGENTSIMARSMAGGAAGGTGYGSTGYGQPPYGEAPPTA